VTSRSVCAAEQRDRDGQADRLGGLEKAAADDNRSLTSLMEKLLIKHLKKGRGG